MRDRQLPLLAKTIYAYFCAYAGKGYQAYPKRDKIVRDLRMNKNTYTKHLNTLISEGYIAKERTASGNLYTIVRTVPSYEKPAQADDDMTDMLVMDSVSAQGFGTVPKIAMLDTRLTAQAKGIYAYFSSFAGAGTTAFPRHTTIMRDLNLSHVTYYTHYNLLLNFGYLTVEQRKTNGKYAVSLYRLTDCVEAPVMATSPSRKGNRKSMYEKLVHSENGDIISNLENKG
jgi:DNA-binding transcriptional MocR family regulator